jgi:hypothetical protein
MKFSIKKIFSIGVVCIGLWTSSCSDYLDVNVDPTRVNEGQVTLASLLPTVIEATSQAQFHCVRNSAGLITQHITSVTGTGEDQHIEVRFGNAWATLYLTAMTNLNILIEKANTQSSPHYAGVAKILLAYNLNMATTAWENIPFSQAFTIQNLKPDFDTQEAIYTKTNQLLDEAVLDLDKTSLKKIGAEDVIHAGNLVRWKAAAKALKARISLQASAKNGVTAANNALTALSSAAMTGNADDLQLIYNLRNLNPWHSGVALANVTGNLTVRHSQQLVDAMNGTTYGVFDPRMPIVGGRVAANAAATTWIGVENGSGNSGNVDFSATSWHSKNISPIQFITFSEQKFIQAEAEFLKNGGTTTSTGTTAVGYQAYLDGITANMMKLGVTDTARTRYMADPKVAVGAGNLTLQLIMGEKFKALFLNSETWNDYRQKTYLKIWICLKIKARHWAANGLNVLYIH